MDRCKLTSRPYVSLSLVSVNWQPLIASARRHKTGEWHPPWRPQCHPLILYLVFPRLLNDTISIGTLFHLPALCFFHLTFVFYLHIGTYRVSPVHRLRDLPNVPSTFLPCHTRQKNLSFLWGCKISFHGNLTHWHPIDLNRQGAGQKKKIMLIIHYRRVIYLW